MGLARQQVGPGEEAPRNEAIYYGNLALTLGNLGQREEQLLAALRAWELEPENLRRWLHVGKALGELGHWLKDKHQTGKDMDPEPAFDAYLRDGSVCLFLMEPPPYESVSYCTVSRCFNTSGRLIG